VELCSLGRRHLLLIYGIRCIRAFEAFSSSVRLRRHLVLPESLRAMAKYDIRVRSLGKVLACNFQVMEGRRKDSRCVGLTFARPLIIWWLVHQSSWSLASQPCGASLSQFSLTWY
jgi:hypothetical protein